MGAQRSASPARAEPVPTEGPCPWAEARSLLGGSEVGASPLPGTWHGGVGKAWARTAQESSLQPDGDGAETIPGSPEQCPVRTWFGGRGSESGNQVETMKPNTARLVLLLREVTLIPTMAAATQRRSL